MSRWSTGHQSVTHNSPHTARLDPGSVWAERGTNMLQRTGVDGWSGGPMWWVLGWVCLCGWVGSVTAEGTLPSSAAAAPIPRGVPPPGPMCRLGGPIAHLSRYLPPALTPPSSCSRAIRFGLAFFSHGVLEAVALGSRCAKDRPSAVQEFADYCKVDVQPGRAALAGPRLGARRRGKWLGSCTEFGSCRARMDCRGGGSAGQGFTACRAPRPSDCPNDAGAACCIASANACCWRAWPGAAG